MNLSLKEEWLHFRFNFSHSFSTNIFPNSHWPIYIIAAIFYPTENANCQFHPFSFSTNKNEREKSKILVENEDENGDPKKWQKII